MGRDTVRMVVDFCKSEYGEHADRNTCEVVATMPLFNEKLNLNTPLQLGGMLVEELVPVRYKWTHTPVGKSFKGNIRNVQLNSILIDLASPAISPNSSSGCSQGESMCNKVSSCGPNGEYDKIIKACKCRSGWTGSDCSKDTTPITLTRSSFIEYQSSTAIEYFHTEIQLRFRTRYDG